MRFEIDWMSSCLMGPETPQQRRSMDQEIHVLVKEQYSYSERACGSKRQLECKILRCHHWNLTVRRWTVDQTVESSASPLPRHCVYGIEPNLHIDDTRGSNHR